MAEIVWTERARQDLKEIVELTKKPYVPVLVDECDASVPARLGNRLGFSARTAPCAAIGSSR